MRITFPVDFAALFDRVFAVRRIRGIAVPSFTRSVLMSCISLLVLGSLWVFDKETISRDLRFGNATARLTHEAANLGLIYGFGTIITNWIPDYLSLIQSRWVIGRIESTKSPLARVPWFVLDAALTLAIAFGAIYLGAKLILPFVPGHASLVVGCFTAETFTLSAAWDIYVSGLRFETPPATLNYDAAGVYIYSTFITSVWLWLHLGARFAHQLAAVAFPSAQRIATKSFFFFGGLLAVALLFWTLHFSTRTYDVRVVGNGDAYTTQLASELRASGLTVTTEDHRATVVVVNPGTPRDSAAIRSLQREVACGARPRSALLRPYPAQSLSSIATWAKRASALLPRDQIAQCRFADGRPPLPACD